MRTKRLTIIAPLLFLSLFFACGGDNSTASQQEGLGATGDPSIDGLTAKISETPNNAALYAQRAELFYEKNGFDEAINDLQKAITLDSLNADYYHLLGDVYLDYFNSRMALRTMERAATLFPDRIPTLLKLSEFQLILKQYQASMQTIDRILRIDPQNAEAFFMFGTNFKEVGDTARAINSFQKAVELDPELIDGWINLGYLQAVTGSPLAERYFDNALRLDPGNILAIHAKADFLRDFKDDLNGAIALYRQINEIDPQYKESYFNAGLLYMELDSVGQAYDQFDLTIKVSPTHIRAYFFRGYAAELLGNIEQARADYRQALKMAPEYELAEKGLARVGDE
jgi:tetratricopeptide (TPR) repeat protein